LKIFQIFFNTENHIENPQDFQSLKMLEAFLNESKANLYLIL